MTHYLAAISLVIIAIMQPAQAATDRAVFAGGCFWCMEAAFADLPGVERVTSGYTGGTVADPTYDQVSRGTTGHVEAVEVAYDPAKVTYARLLTEFWDNVDPTDPNGQFCDKGSQYAAGIFYTDARQADQAKASLKKVEAKLGQTVATFIRPAGPFYPAEAYHQGYHRKNALRYQLYKTGCGRAQTLKKVWQKQ